MNWNGDNTVCIWMIFRQILYHFTVANTRFTAPLIRRGKTKFATVKRHNLCLQVIQSQTCFPLIYQLYSLNFKLHSLNFQFYSLNFKLHLWASRGECPGSLCHSPSVGVGVGVDKNFNLGAVVFWQLLLIIEIQRLILLILLLI